jgi:hypothetical protein
VADTATMALVISVTGTVIALASLCLGVLGYRRGVPRPRIALSVPQKHGHGCLDPVDVALWVRNKGGADLRVTDVKCRLIGHFGDECVERPWVVEPINEIEPFVVPKFEGVNTTVTVPIKHDEWHQKCDGQNGSTFVTLLVDLADGSTLTTDRVSVHETLWDRFQRWTSAHDD